MTNLLNILLMAPQGQGQQQSGWLSFLPLLLIIVVFYFFFIRPQMKRSKDQKKFKESLQKGQKIITIGGIHGKIVEIQDTTVTIEVENGVRLRVEKTAVAMDNSQTIENK
ncbi:MAG: preprotein translocase subunit YajC [Bacteroidales bacterium]|nr:preprotein translocase subunit YajC [Bacteroidales bacterium]MDD4603571.1 preprotein translocase subunit YajC [Bacteroidales bacterium]